MNDASIYGRLFALLSSMYICKPSRESLANWRQLLRDELLYEAKELRFAFDPINLDSEKELGGLLWATRGSYRSRPTAVPSSGIGLHFAQTRHDAIGL
jgi:hypothetical protein